jgi:hypothetical protein
MTLAVTAVMAIGGWGMYFGANYFPKTTYAEKEVIKEVLVSTTTPVLQRIAKCESNNSQTKNGQVQIHVNTNGSVDIGKYMVNLQVWGATATKMGYDLTNEKDNEAFAKWLYENKGTEDWSASQKCWYK